MNAPFDDRILTDLGAGNKNTNGGIIGALCVASALLLTSCAGAGSTAQDKVDVVNVVIGTDGGKNYNPITSGNQFVAYFLTMAYDSLLRLTEDGEVVPSLATGYEWSDDNLTLRFKLRDDVVFHDGEAFNAEAVKTFIDAALSQQTSTLKVELAAVESVAVVDDATVAFHLSAPDGALPAALSGRAGMIISPAAMQNEDLDRFPVGTGPYVATEHQPGDSITFDRFQDYYDFDEARAEQVIMTVTTDSEARLRALQTGQADIGGLGPTQMVTAEASGLKLDIPETSKLNHTMFLKAAAGSPLADARVRNAISYGIDREAINESVYGGICSPTANIFAKDSWYGSPTAALDEFEYDPKKAKRLLTDAGYPDGFTMTTASIAAAPYSTLNEALSGQLAAIGITADIKVGEAAQIVPGFTQQKMYDSYISVLPGAADPAGITSLAMAQTALLNPGGLVIPEIAELATEGRAETDQAKRAKIYQEIDELNAEQSFHLPICALPYVQGVSDRLEGMRMPANGIADYSNLRVTE